MIKKLICLMFLSTFCFATEINYDSDTIVIPSAQQTIYQDVVNIPCDHSQTWKVMLVISSDTINKNENEIIKDWTIRSKLTSGPSFSINYDIRCIKKYDK